MSGQDKRGPRIATFLSQLTGNNRDIARSGGVVLTNHQQASQLPTKATSQPVGSLCRHKSGYQNAQVFRAFFIFTS